MPGFLCPAFVRGLVLISKPRLVPRRSLTLLKSVSRLVPRDGHRSRWHENPRLKGDGADFCFRRGARSPLIVAENRFIAIFVLAVVCGV